MLKKVLVKCTTNLIILEEEIPLSYLMKIVLPNWSTGSMLLDTLLGVEHPLLFSVFWAKETIFCAWMMFMEALTDFLNKSFKSMELATLCVLLTGTGKNKFKTTQKFFGLKLLLIPL